MSALVRTIRRAILGTAANRNQVLKEAIEELGIEAGQSTPGSLLKLQKIIFNSGRDSEVQLRRALTGLNLTGGSVGSGEAARIQDALLRSGRVSELRAALDDLIALDGGGDAPAWVGDMEILGGTPPEIAMSFVSDNGAWSESGGEAALTTVVGEDSTGGMLAGWGTPSAFNPDDLSANGYSDEDDGGEAVAFTGAALTKILAGATIVYTIRKISGATSFTMLLVGNADGSKVLAAGEDNNTVHCRMYSYNAVNETIADCLTTAVSPGALNKIAITITPTRFEMSVNGSAAVAVVLDTSEFQNMVWAGIDPQRLDRGTIVSIGFYDPVAVGNLPTVSTL